MKDEKTKVFATSFGTFGSVSLVEERLGVGFPPFKVEGGKIDLDFASLMLTDRLVLDEETIDRTFDVKINSYNRLKESINALKGEGFIETVSFRNIYEKNKEAIEIAVATELREPTKWLAEVKYNTDSWAKFQPNLQKALGRYYDPIILGEVYGIICYLKQSGKEINRENVEKYKKHIYSNKKTWKKWEKEEIRKIVKPYLEEMYFNVVLRKTLKIPFVEWEPMGMFYETYYKSKLEKERPKKKSDIKKVEELFNVVFPDFRPKDANHLILLLKDPRIKDFRKFIAEAVKWNRKLKPLEMQKYLSKLIEIDVNSKSIRNIGLKTSRGLSYLTPLPGAVTQPISELAEKGAEAVWHPEIKDGKSQLAWLYMLVESNNKIIREKPSILGLE